MISTFLSLWGWPCLWSPHLHSPGDLSCLSVGLFGSDSLCSPPSPLPASQVALKNCSAVADTHCGCKPGWFMDCVVSQCPHSSPFRCHPCPDCEALHRRTQAPCGYPRSGPSTPTPPSPASSSPVLTHTISRTAGYSGDTHCGTCLPGFYEYGNSCMSCPT